MWREYLVYIIETINLFVIVSAFSFCSELQTLKRYDLSLSVTSFASKDDRCVD